MWPNPQESADLVTFTEEILKIKLYFENHLKLNSFWKLVLVAYVIGTFLKNSKFCKHQALFWIFTNGNTEFTFLGILFGRFIYVYYTRINWKHVSIVICLKIVLFQEKILPKTGKICNFLLLFAIPWEKFWVILS